MLRPQVEVTSAAAGPVVAIRESAALARRFEAIVFDWDGTAVPDRRAGASHLRGLVEEASAHGLELAVVSGTHLGNVDSQLSARPAGPGGLLLALNRGSEVFSVNRERPHVRLLRRVGVPADDIVDVARETTADLIVLAWSQNLGPGRARVVSETLAHTTIPVLLLPVLFSHHRGKRSRTTP